MPELPVITVKWNEESSQINYIKTQLMNNRPVLLNVIGNPFLNEVKNELISENTNVNMSDIYKFRNRFHGYINDQAQKARPVSSKNYPQYTTLMDEDTYCNLSWLGFCKSVNATPSLHFPCTIVGGVSKTIFPIKTRIVDGKTEDYKQFAATTTEAHWHAPPVMNLALSGSCKKLYRLIAWEHMNDSQKRSNTSKIEDDQESKGHVYTATIGMHEAANCILLPPKMLHEIT